MAAEEITKPSGSLFESNQILLPLKVNFDKLFEHYRSLIQKFSTETIEGSFYHEYVCSEVSNSAQLCVTKYKGLLEKEQNRKGLNLFLTLEQPFIELKTVILELAKMSIILGYRHNQMLQYMSNLLVSLLPADTDCSHFKDILLKILLINTTMSKVKVIPLVRACALPASFGKMPYELEQHLLTEEAILEKNHGKKSSSLRIELQEYLKTVTTSKDISFDHHQELLGLFEQLIALEHDIFSLKDTITALKQCPDKLVPTIFSAFLTPEESCHRWYELLQQERKKISTEQQEKFKNTLSRLFGAADHMFIYVDEELLCILASSFTNRLADPSFTKAFHRWQQHQIRKVTEPTASKKDHKEILPTALPIVKTAVEEKSLPDTTDMPSSENKPRRVSPRSPHEITRRSLPTTGAKQRLFHSPHVLIPSLALPKRKDASPSSPREASSPLQHKRSFHSSTASPTTPSLPRKIATGKGGTNRDVISQSPTKELSFASSDVGSSPRPFAHSPR